MNIYTGKDVQTETAAQQIVIRPALRVRQGWDEQFQRMAARGDDILLDGSPASLSLWDDEEWEWVGSPAGQDRR